MNKLKCAVIGVGYLGKFHASKYASIKECELIAVVDTNKQVAQEVAKQNNTKALTDYTPLLGNIDAVSIAVPTSLHYCVARDFLSTGAHVLVEKPITVTVAEADELIALAKTKKSILQVGHLERFNPAIMALDKEEKPLFIEAHRISSFNSRANDVSVVLDLMIHDIDIIQALVDLEIEHIDASGTAVLTQDIDVANARLTFTNGCIANVTASRISNKIERKMRMFRPSSYISVDFKNKILSKHKLSENKDSTGVQKIISEELAFSNQDMLLKEIQHFVTCIKTKKNLLISGETGRLALKTAIEIGKLLTPTASNNRQAL